MAVLITGAVVLGLVFVLGAVTNARSRITRRAADESAAPEPISAPPPVVGPVFGVRHEPGADCAPQPVFGPTDPTGSRSAYQPHRPMVTGPTVASARIGADRRGAHRPGVHRRGSDAEELARLQDLHRNGALSDDEFATLRGRLA